MNFTIYFPLLMIPPTSFSLVFSLSMLAGHGRPRSPTRLPPLLRPRTLGRRLSPRRARAEPRAPCTCRAPPHPSPLDPEPRLTSDTSPALPRSCAAGIAARALRAPGQPDDGEPGHRVNRIGGLKMRRSFCSSASEEVRFLMIQSVGAQERCKERNIIFLAHQHRVIIMNNF